MTQHDDGEDPREPGPFGWAFAAAALAMAFGGAGVLGFLGPQWPPVLALVVVTVGAVGAGWIEAIPREYGLRALLVTALSWSAFGVVSTGATIWYLEDRTHIYSSYELLIPVLIGLAPFGVIRVIVWLATRKKRRMTIADVPLWRVGAPEIALAAAVLAMPIAGWAVARPRVAAAQTLAEKIRTHNVLTFVAHGPGGVTYEGHPVDRAAIDDLCRRAAAADPQTTVVVDTSKDADREAVVGALTAAQSVGLRYELIRTD